MNLTRTRNKLLKNGFCQSKAGLGYDEWIDVIGNGTPISYSHDGKLVNGALKIHGRTPDRPQFDEFSSSYSRNVKQAIMLSRV